MAKYDSGGSRITYESGSNDQVLANKLGITDPVDMDEAELELLVQLYESVLGDEVLHHQLSSAELKSWHYRWLFPVYDWAGKERSVNMAKADFSFAAAAQIPKLLQTLDCDYLTRLTPCTNLDDEALIEAIATVHVEFILIHPFREGNGRLSRLLADVMAAQAGYGTLDYSAWDQNRKAYYAAIAAGLSGNYEPMKRWVEKAFQPFEKN